MRDHDEITLGLAETWRVLAEAGDELAVEVADRYDDDRRAGSDGYAKGPLGQLLGQRNNSLLAHGLKAIDQVAVESLLQHVTSIVAAHAADRGDVSTELLERTRLLTWPWTADSLFGEPDDTLLDK